MKYAQLVCATSGNVGDDIQSIAAAARLPKVDLCVDREKLDTVDGPSPVWLIMNAWFMHSNRWPPSEFLRPIFVGFHVAPKSRDLIASHAPYLKRYEPIGTRDRGTAEFLRSLGIKAEVTYCLSLTFPTRVNEPAHGKVIIVDANAIQVPRVTSGNGSLGCPWLVCLRYDSALLSNAPVTMLASQNALHDNPCILDGDDRSL